MFWWSSEEEKIGVVVFLPTHWIFQSRSDNLFLTFNPTPTEPPPLSYRKSQLYFLLLFLSFSHSLSFSLRHTIMLLQESSFHNKRFAFLFQFIHVTRFGGTSCRHGKASRFMSSTVSGDIFNQKMTKGYRCFWPKRIEKKCHAEHNKGLVDPWRSSDQL